MWMYEVFSKIIEMSLMATVVILAVLIVRVLFRRLPKLFSYILWSVVLFRLICPISIAAPFSMFQVFEITEEENQTTEMIIDVQINLQDEASSYVDSVDMEIENSDGASNMVTILNEKKAEAEFKQFGRQWVTVAWMLGISVVLGYSVLSLVRLKKKMIGVLNFKDNIYLCDYIKTPFVMGIVKPKIYLPSSLGAEEKEYIILHEQIHIKRGDHIFRLIAFLALAIHWFNPFVWLAYFLSGVDMEMSCDEAVMKKVGVDIRAAYSTSLLCLATGKRYINGALLAFGEGNVKNRIINIMKFKKPALVTVVVAVLVVIVLFVVMGSNPKMEIDEEASTLPENETIVLDERADTSYVYVEGQTELEKNQNDLLERQEEMVEELDLLEEKVEEIKEQQAQLSEESRREQVEVWARAFCRRDGKIINSMITPEVKAAMIESGIHQGDEGGVGFGWSSPWPWGEDTDYRVLEVTESSATILYYAWVSDPHVWVWCETLQFHEEDGKIVIDAEELKEMYGICSLEEFLQAYPDGIGGTPMDYLNTTMAGWSITTGEMLNQNALEEQISKYYQQLLSPDTAVVYLLNLLDNPNKVKAEVRMDSDGSVSVIVLFLEYGEGFIVNMVQPYGEEGIWLVEDIEIDFDKID